MIDETVAELRVLEARMAADPELLLLDEATNDLDDDAVDRLEQRLATPRGTIVAVTHDRVFLQRLTDTILEVDGGRITRYENGYAGYLAAIPRKLEFAVFGHRASRSRGRGHGAMGRLRMARGRIGRLEQEPVGAAGPAGFHPLHL